MEQLTSTIRAQPIVPGASVFQSRRLHPMPHSVAIDLGNDTLVITLDEAFPRRPRSAMLVRRRQRENARDLPAVHCRRFGFDAAVSGETG